MLLRIGAVLAAIAMLAACMAAPAAAAPADPDARLRELTKQADDLEKRYRGTILDLEEARRKAQQATTRVKRLRTQLRTARRKLVEFAQLAYMGGAVDGVHLFAANGDPGTLATVTYLALHRAERLKNVQRLLDEQRKAAAKAEAEIEKLRKQIKELQSKRSEVERLLRRFGFQTPDAGTGLTPRMITVRNAILRQFALPHGYGCLRPGDPGEHGKGRACDFMVSSGGRMPDATGLARGDAIAQWCIQNARRYGIMYIIWKQRYYDLRTGSGWRPMADRGSVTANHWDHVHVSVL
ncbi:coiled-coil domain-containing protein [Thermobispora bispora]|uniref:ARB-07466-like C-terminal domain-containing protein n=1 Tax=Thermobispora bispora (strain ATCC 19993 / DSM 43833 / CBS 139.67 / JCM 10125 / KCTC 9307 / NBRC 14880 / R51) TaxID=469371 RepID=D6Y647_THEBD|nr:hypothetical protein [Thermobispora bispora]ADG89463.1 hypothetical protein Tbis_2764 [Thermobispora bispora DSM 43833]